MKPDVVDPMRKRRRIDIFLDSLNPFYDKNSIEYKIMGSMLKRKKKKKGKTI